MVDEDGLSFTLTPSQLRDASSRLTADEVPARVRSRIETALEYPEEVLLQDFVQASLDPRADPGPDDALQAHLRVVATTDRRLWLADVHNEQLTVFWFDDLRITHDKRNVLVLETSKPDSGLSSIGLMFAERRAPVSEHLRESVVNDAKRRKQLRILLVTALAAAVVVIGFAVTLANYGVVNSVGQPRCGTPTDLLRQIRVSSYEPTSLVALETETMAVTVSVDLVGCAPGLYGDAELSLSPTALESDFEVGEVLTTAVKIGDWPRSDDAREATHTFEWQMKAISAGDRTLPLRLVLEHPGLRSRGVTTSTGTRAAPSNITDAPSSIGAVRELDLRVYVDPAELDAVAWLEDVAAGLEIQPSARPAMTMNRDSTETVVFTLSGETNNAPDSIDGLFVFRSEADLGDSSETLGASAPTDVLTFRPGETIDQDLQITLTPVKHGTLTGVIAVSLAPLAISADGTPEPLADDVTVRESFVFFVDVERTLGQRATDAAPAITAVLGAITALAAFAAAFTKKGRKTLRAFWRRLKPEEPAREPPGGYL